MQVTKHIAVLAITAALCLGSSHVEPADQSSPKHLVILKVLVSEEGKPLQVEVEKSSDQKEIDRAAIDAAYRQRLLPYRHEGRPVEAWIRIRFEFQLEQSEQGHLRK